MGSVISIIKYGYLNNTKSLNKQGLTHHVDFADVAHAVDVYITRDERGATCGEKTPQPQVTEMWLVYPDLTRLPCKAPTARTGNVSICKNLLQNR